MKSALRQSSAMALVCLLVAACSSTSFEAVTDFDGGFDFSGVRSVAIQPIDRTKLNNARISDMQVQRINDALAAELQRRGYRVVADNAGADMYLTWHLVTDERVDVRSYNSMSYYNCWMCGPPVSDVSVRQYTQGTFIVDMIDPERNQSVWRSTIESRLEPNPKPDESAQRRQEAARAIFAEFPPA